MTNDSNIPGWLPGAEPDRSMPAEVYILRSAVVERTNLVDSQVAELVRTGRLTAYKVPANKKLTMFKVSDLDAVFTPVMASEV